MDGAGAGSGKRLNDLVFLALSVLSANGSGSVTPELLYVMQPEQMYDLIRLFGGRTLRVPTEAEYRTSLLAALYIYHRSMEGVRDEWFADRYGLTNPEMRAVHERYQAWVKSEASRDIMGVRGGG